MLGWFQVSQAKRLLHLPYPEMVVELPDVNGVCEINDTSSFALKRFSVSFPKARRQFHCAFEPNC
jgi:hypothetical protein